MTTIYPYPGASGPWACEDSQVLCEGFLDGPPGMYELSRVGRGPTVEGADYRDQQHPEMAVRRGETLVQYDQRKPHTQQSRY